MSGQQHIKVSPIKKITLNGEDFEIIAEEGLNESIHFKINSTDNRILCRLNKNSNVKIFTELSDVQRSKLDFKFELYSGSTLESVCLIENCKNLELSICANLVEPQSSADMRNFCGVGERDFVKIKTTQIHIAPESKSSMLTKSVLDDHSNVSVSGVIDVLEHSHGSISSQHTKNMMLSEYAHTEVFPSLNILANDVTCHHGAASGGINDNEIIYMQSRGIDWATSKKILANGVKLSMFDNLSGEFWESIIKL